MLRGVASGVARGAAAAVRGVAKATVAVAKAAAGTVRGMRAVANSRGGQDFGAWLSHGRAELANIIVHGQAAPIYPGRGQPAQAPTVTPIRAQAPAVTPTVTPVQQPNWEAIKAQAHRNAPPPVAPMRAAAVQQGRILHQHNVTPDVNQAKIDMRGVLYSPPITPQHSPSKSVGR